jgi:hypothetical protein
MAISKRKIISHFTEFPKQEIIDDESKDILKKEMNFFRTFEPTSDPVQEQRNEKIWKHSLGYYLLHPEKFRYGLKDF